MLLLMSAPLLSAQVPRSKHVYIVAEENHSYETIVGSSNMPYLNSLLKKGALATQFYANQHGSLENYFWVTAGQKITDNNSTTSVFNVDNIERHLLSHGRTFKSYAQSLPYAGYTGLTWGAYLKRHAPLIYFTDMADSSLKFDHVSTSVMAKDIVDQTLPNFAFITPDGNHDMHNCPNGLAACEQTADTWLKDNIGPLLASPEFQPGGDGVLIIWSDEGNLSSDNRCSATVLTGCGGRIVVAMIGPEVKVDYRSIRTYHHQSVLRTMLELEGDETSFPGAAATAPDMGEFFKSTSPTDSPVGSVTILAPTSSTVSSPVNMQANATSANAITAMRIYVDGKDVYTTSASHLDTNIALARGGHSLTFQAWDSKGNVFKASKAITVE